MTRPLATFSWLVIAHFACTEDPPRQALPEDTAPSHSLTGSVVSKAAPAPFLASEIPIQPAPSADPEGGIGRIALLVPKRSYLEDRCSNSDVAGIPARRCTYRAGDAPLEVTLAAIPRETLARWIFDAASTAEPADVDALATRLARYVVEQSSGTVPLEGDVWEDMARDGVGKTYQFDRGVSLSSGTCRPMSLTRTEWCKYVASEAGTPRDACLETVKSPEAWSALCVSWIREGLAQGSHPGLRVRARILNANPRSGP